MNEEQHSETQAQSASSNTDWGPSDVRSSWTSIRREPSDLAQNLHDTDRGALAKNESSADERDGPPKREQDSEVNDSRNKRDLDHNRHQKESLFSGASCQSPRAISPNIIIVLYVNLQIF